MCVFLQQLIILESKDFTFWKDYVLGDVIKKKSTFQTRTLRRTSSFSFLLTQQCWDSKFYRGTYLVVDHYFHLFVWSDIHITIAEDDFEQLDKSMKNVIFDWFRFGTILFT